MGTDRGFIKPRSSKYHQFIKSQSNICLYIALAHRWLFPSHESGHSCCMDERKSFWGKFFEAAFFAVAFEFLKWLVVWVSPFAAAAFTISAGLAAQIPTVLLIPIVAFTFAATTTGMLRFDEWWARRTPRNKLIFHSVSLGIDYERDPITGQPTALKKIQVIFTFQNIASFPVSYVVDEIKSSAAQRINPNPHYHTKGSEIGPLSAATYRDDIIDMQSSPLRPFLEGTAMIKLRYGRRGYERYEISKQVNVFAALDPTTKSYLSINYMDAPT